MSRSDWAIKVTGAITRNELLAKSIKNGRKITLETHLQDTAQAARLVFTTDTRVGRNFLKAFKLSNEESDDFLLNLEIACLFHDIGKANEGFINAIAGAKNAQSVRHEHLSALVMQLPAIQAWLTNNKRIKQPIVLGAVLSHHLKARYGEIGAKPEGCLLHGCVLFFDDPQVDAILNQIAKTAQLGPAPSLSQYHYFAHEMEVWKNCILQLERNSKKLCRALEDIDNNEGQASRRCLAALKTALIIADSIASGVVREGDSIEGWINENLHLREITSDELFEKIIVPCTKRIEQRTGVPYEAASFQQGVAMLGQKSLLRAGCGSGKTLAAYYWAAKQLERAEFGRVIFLYPTRGTATEGFKDYTGWAPEEEAMLLHGQSKYVLTNMLENPPDSAQKKNYLNETNERLFALANYHRRFFSATVDQFLSFLQLNYSSICLSVILTDSVVILDEIHSYDRKMFATTLEFLKSMNVPTLCMTATLKESRVNELIKCGMDVFPTMEQATELQDLTRAENRKRYDVRWVNNSTTASQICSEAIRNGKKILWVVNTVDRCQQIALQLKNGHLREVVCYHSRFKLGDREQHHNTCVEAFQVGTKRSGIIAVTTQVCEMSLDLDADVLISEIAPISSLIQRMGRVNRHAQYREEKFIAPVYFYKPGESGEFTSKPYTKEEIEDAELFVDWLTRKDESIVSQASLTEGLMEFTRPERELDSSSCLFESGYFATPGQLREIDEFTVPSILNNNDLTEARKLLSERKSIEQLIVPVPRRFQIEEHPPWLPKYICVASAAHYSKEIGFQSKITDVR